MIELIKHDIITLKEEKVEQSLRRRYVLFFIIIISIPIFVLVLYFGTISGQIILKTNADRIEETLSRIAENIDAETRRISILASAIFNDKLLQKTALQYLQSTNEENKYLLLRQIETSLISFFNTTDLIGYIQVELADGVSVYQKNSAGQIQLSDIAQMASHVPSSARRKTFLVDYLLADHFQAGDSGNINPLIRIILVNTEDGLMENPLRAIYLAFRIPSIHSIYSDTAVIFPGRILIANADNRIILDSGREHNGTLIEEISFVLDTNRQTKYRAIDYRSQSYLLASKSLAYSGWTIFGLIEKDVITGEYRRLQITVMAAYMGLLILFILFSLLFYRKILSPISDLNRTMLIISEGDYSTKMPDTGVLEFKDTTRIFNNMIKKIDDLTYEKQLEEKEKYMHELEALQYQINPHFLSNTLNNIRIMAMLIKAENIKNLTTSLMRMVSTIFSHSHHQITVKAEFDLIRSYSRIMHYRFSDSFSIQYDCPEELENAAVPKMILQPIVENSLLHGRIPGVMQIRISVRSQQDMLSVIVSDDGKGIPAEKISALFHQSENRPLGSMTHIGLYNIHRRIVLHYGSQYGLDVSSQTGRGTAVILRLPYEELTHSC